MIGGDIGGGKTTMLNAMSLFIRPTLKIVSIEDTQEIRLPHQNWEMMVTRQGLGTGAGAVGETGLGSISMFDLLRAALRQRPDFIIVGEIRGEEAFVLFQALATGHGGLTTLHADSLTYTVKRLTSHPMDVAEAYIPLLNVAPLVERVKLPVTSKGGITFGRRIKTLTEIVDYENYKTISQWNPVDDTFTVNLTESQLLKRIASRYGIPVENILEEVASRAKFLRALKEKGVRRNVDLSKQITNYYNELNHLGLRRK